MFSQGENIFEEAKERSLVDYLEAALGAKSYKSGSQIRMDACPHCGHSTPGSGKLRIKGDRNWSCFTCGEFGSIIDAALHLDAGVNTPLQAAQEIVHGNTPPTITPQQRQLQIQADDVKRKWQVWVVQRIHEASRNSFDKSAWDYLVRTRGLSPGVVNDAWHRGTLAGLPSNREQATLWLSSVVGDTELHYAGLWKEKSPTPWIAGRPVVQFVDNHEYAEFRIAFKPTNPKTKKSLGVGRPGTPYYWIGKDRTRCLVTEGCLESLAALSMNYQGSLIATAGTGSWNLSWFKALAAQGVQVFDLAFNNDHRILANGTIANPGKDAQIELAKELANIGVRYTDASPKEIGDINDALLRQRSHGH